MPEPWIEQWYAYAPAGTLNVREPDDAPVMFAGELPVSKVTSWPVSPFHVTVPPTAMSTIAGENDRPTAFTVENRGKPPVTAIVMKLDAFALPSVAEAVMFVLPAGTPETR